MASVEPPTHIGAWKAATACGLVALASLLALRWTARADATGGPLVDPPRLHAAAEGAEPGADLEAAASDEPNPVRSAVASGRLHLSVVDEDGRMVAGVPIDVFRGSARRGSVAPGPILSTTSASHAIAHDTASGDFTIMANHSGNRAPCTPAVVEVTVAAGAVVTAELKVRQANASLTVRVVDDTGQPVANVPVRVAPVGQPGPPGDPASDPPGLATVGTEVLTFTHARDKGAALGIEPKAMSLDVDAESLLSTMAEAARVHAEVGKFLAMAKQQGLPARRGLAEIPTLEKWVAEAKAVQAATSKRLLKEALRERAQWTQAGFDVAKQASARGAIQTDDQGIARFEPLFAGDYVVLLTGNGSLAAAVRKGTSQRVTVARRAQASVDFRLPRNGTVVVHVRGPEAAAKGRIRVTARDKAFDDERATFDLRSGRPRQARLPPGGYVVSCELAPAAPVVALAPRDVVVASGQTTEVVVELVEAPASLSGRVLDEAGAPVAGIEVRATPDGYEPKATRTAPSGAFEIRGLPRLPLRVAVDPATAKRKSHDALAWFGSAAQPEAFYGAPLEGVTLRLQRGTTLRIDLRRSPESPMPKTATVRLTPGPTLAPLIVDVSSEGFAEVRHVRSGRYRIELLGPNEAVLASTAVDVDPARAPKGILEVRLLPPAAVGR